MSRSSITLKADHRTARCAAAKVFAVTIPKGLGQFTVTKRTDDVKAVAAELRRIRRTFKVNAWVFHLPTGSLVIRASVVQPLPTVDQIRAISDTLGRN